MTYEQDAEALAAMRNDGLVLDHIEWDGKFHRCGMADKPNSKSGWYKAFPDGRTVIYGDWRESDDRKTWTDKSVETMAPEERRLLKAQQEQAQREREAEQARIHAEAATKAQAIYSRATDCAGHDYLARKGVKPVPSLKVSTDPKYDSLIVPVCNGQGALTGAQFISSDGQKKFLTGTAKKGCFSPIGKDATKSLLLCEGVATGLSLHECIGLPVLVAFDAGNLLPVAKMARSKYPDREIILCADNDTETEGNPGLTKATEAAKAVGGSVAVPDLGGRKGDWNDLHQEMGAEEVKRQFMEHRKPEAPAHEEKEEKLPPSFSLRSGGTQPGLWHVELKESGDPIETWIGSPLYVLGATRDENGNAWGLELVWFDPDGRVHTWAMPRSFLVGKDSSAWLGRLTDEGWSGNPDQKAQKLLARYLATYKTGRRILCVPSTGWHHGVFVLPDEVIGKKCAHIKNMSDVSDMSDSAATDADLGPSDNTKSMSDVSDGEQIVLQARSPHNPYQQAGTLDGWRSTIGKWAQGNSRIALALCASLSAPLLEVAGQESGGFNWTGQSSTGKTTALIAAGSAWGKGASSNGYVQSWRATSNGLEGLAELHSDTALCLDEIGQAPGRTVNEAAYMLANGMGKTRARRDGSTRRAKSWRCTILSTGEKGLAEKIAEDGGRVQAGQTVRLIDVPADAGAGMGIFENLHGFESPQAFADAIKRAAAIHYGHAARAFICKIQEHREDVTSTLNRGLEAGMQALCPSDADGQVKRVAKRFLLCAMAGEMASEWGLLSWEQGEALAAVKVCFDAWLSFRGGSGAAEDTAIVEQVRLFIEQHGASRFQDIDGPGATCINRAGFRRDTYNGTIYYILPESFKEVCKGHEATRAARVLRDAKLLLTEGDRLKCKAPELPGLGRPRCYVITFGDGGSQNETA